MIDVRIKGRAGDFNLDVAFAAGPGITALFGPSGAGKSSVVRMIAGLSTPDEGHVRINGTALFDAAAHVDLPPEARRVGVVFQTTGLFPHLTVRSNLTYGSWAGRRKPHFSFDRIVGLLDIGHLLDRRPQTLSGGEAQRAAIGRALLSDPAILLLDEPFSALDQRRKEEIMPFLESVRDELAIPMIYVSHSMAEVTRLADTLVVMAHGQVAASGEITALLADRNVGALTGMRMTGSLLHGTVVGHDARYGLTRVAVGNQHLWLAIAPLQEGEAVRLRVSPRDVMIALTMPEDISARNALSGVIEHIVVGDGPIGEITLDAGGQKIRASVTRMAVDALGLKPGLACHAILKVVALEGRMARRRP